MYGVTSCRGKTTQVTWGGFCPEQEETQTDERRAFPVAPSQWDGPSHHNHPWVQQCQVQVVDVRVPWVILGHLGVGKTRLAGALQSQPRHCACTEHSKGQGHDSPSLFLPVSAQLSEAVQTRAKMSALE